MHSAHVTLSDYQVPYPASSVRSPRPGRHHETRPTNSRTDSRALRSRNQSFGVSRSPRTTGGSSTHGQCSLVDSASRDSAQTTAPTSPALASSRAEASSPVAELATQSPLVDYDTSNQAAVLEPVQIPLVDDSLASSPSTVSRFPPLSNVSESPDLDVRCLLPSLSDVGDLSTPYPVGPGMIRDNSYAHRATPLVVRQFAPSDITSAMLFPRGVPVMCDSPAQDQDLVSIPSSTEWDVGQRRPSQYVRVCLFCSWNEHPAHVVVTEARLTSIRPMRTDQEADPFLHV